MARSPELIDVMAATTGEAKESVSVALSRLRKSNLVPVGGRGPYAIAMDNRSAVRLLIAVCGAVPLETDSASMAVRRFEALPLSRATLEHNGADKDLKSPFMPLDHLPRDHTSGMALMQMVEAGGKEELFSFADRRNGIRQKGFRQSQIRGFVRISFLLPIPQVRIEHQLAAWLRKSWVYGSPIDPDRYNTACREAGLGDRSRVSTITETTIEEIGRVLLRP